MISAEGEEREGADRQRLPRMHRIEHHVGAGERETRDQDGQEGDLRRRVQRPVEIDAWRQIGFAGRCATRHALFLDQ